MKKNILNITNHCIFPPTTGGSKYIHNFLNFLSKKYNVFFINEKNNSNYRNDLGNIKTYEIIKNGKLKFLDISLIFKIIKIIKKENIDIIIIEYPWFGLYFYFIKKITGVKLILQEHNIEYERFKSNKYWFWKILYYYEKWVYKIVDDIFFISLVDFENAKKVFKIGNKGQICNFGINKDIFNIKGNLESKNKLKQKFNVKDEEKIISFFGKLDYYPNVEALDIIFNKIYPKLEENNFKFKIIINGNPIPKQYKKYNNVIFTGNVINIQDYIKGCDIMINPILSGGGVKTKVIESLACGKTIISTKKGVEGISLEVTKDKLITVKNNDWDSFVGEIIKNTGNKDLVSEKFLEEYEWSNIVNNLKL